MKQETLEEAILRIKSENEHYIDEVAFELGAKWQQERSYSEQDVYNIINNYTAFIGLGMKIPYIEWFEQFKKK